MLRNKGLQTGLAAAVAAGYVGYVVKDRFAFHDDVREEKNVRRTER